MSQSFRNLRVILQKVAVWSQRNEYISASIALVNVKRYQCSLDTCECLCVMVKWGLPDHLTWNKTTFLYLKERIAYIDLICSLVFIHQVTLILLRYIFRQNSKLSSQ